MSKEKVRWCKIKASGTGGSIMTYYYIEYEDLNGEIHNGYSSFNILQVERWLEECLEIVEY